MKELDEIHDYWKDPSKLGNKNTPDKYVPGDERSWYLVTLLSMISPKERILELGCNVGRNLKVLYEHGLRNLTGVDISDIAISQTIAPQGVTLVCASIENFLRSTHTEYDVIFTMAVLEHIHPKSEWIFREMVDRTRFIITIEDERSSTWRHYPRLYKSIFEPLGMKQVYEENCKHIPMLNPGFWARVFVKKS